MIRRSVSFVATVALVLWAGYQLAWNKDVVHKVFAHPAQTIGWLAVVVVALIAFISAVRSQHQNPWRKSAELGLAVALGVIAGVNAKHIFSGFNAWFVVGFFGTLVALAILWVLTTWPSLKNPKNVHN